MFQGGGSPQLYYNNCSGRIPGHHKGATGSVRTGNQLLPVMPLPTWTRHPSFISVPGCLVAAAVSWLLFAPALTTTSRLSTVTVSGMDRPPMRGRVCGSKLERAALEVSQLVWYCGSSVAFQEQGKELHPVQHQITSANVQDRSSSSCMLLAIHSASLQRENVKSGRGKKLIVKIISSRTQFKSVMGWVTDLEAF